MHEVKAPTYRIQVLDRMFDMLDLLSEESSGLGVTDLSRKLRLHKSTAHRIVMILESRRFVDRDEASGKYRLGSRLMELGLSVLSNSNMDEVARPHLRGLVKETGETAHLGVLLDSEVVSVVDVESSQTVRTPITVGARTPAYCTSLGKAILAFRPPSEVESYLHECAFQAYTQNTITSFEKFLEELQTIREQGYSVDNEERESGLRCVAAPVWNHSGEVIAAISIAGPTFRVTLKRIPALAAAVKRAAALVSKSLGYPGVKEQRLQAPQQDGSSS